MLLLSVLFQGCALWDRVLRKEPTHALYLSESNPARKRNTDEETENYKCWIVDKFQAAEVV